ncbi:MAG: amidase family protein, partial [Pseudolabrys sp.]
MTPKAYRSCFVPHDIAAPIKGATTGPLTGLSTVVKDMYNIAGERTGCGNPEWLATHAPATRNCPPVQKILDAGATITGKTICDEFFYSVSGANAHYGTPVNARAPGRLPGGSSAGSAAACGAGLCDFALGSDTGGSVRVPASFNGIYGLRPTHERIEHTGVSDMAPTFDVPGWFAATPGVFRKVGSVLLDTRAVPAKIERVVVLEDAFAEAEEPVADLLRTVLEFMSDDLPEMVHGRIAPEGFDTWREAFRIVQAHETWQTFGGFVTAQKPKIGPGVRERMEFAATVTKSQTDAARSVQLKAREHIRHIVTTGTILALP